jgi:hypothetical protein
MARWIFVAVCGAIALAGTPASAQQFIYPAHGQSPAMQQQDQNQCSQWAIQQTGFNPSTLPPVAQNAVRPPIGLFGLFRRHRYEEEQQQNSEAQTAYATGRASYTRAMDVCLTGRGYTVD